MHQHKIFIILWSNYEKKYTNSNSLKVYANKNKKPLIVSKKETNPAMKIAFEQAMDKAIYSLDRLRSVRMDKFIKNIIVKVSDDVSEILRYESKFSDGHNFTETDIDKMIEEKVEKEINQKLESIKDIDQSNVCDLVKEFV